MELDQIGNNNPLFSDLDYQLDIPKTSLPAVTYIHEMSTP